MVIHRPERIVVLFAEFAPGIIEPGLTKGSHAHAMWSRQQHRPTGIVVSGIVSSTEPTHECINSLQRPEISLLVNNELMRNGAQV